MINMHTKFEVSSFSRFRDILGGLQIKNGSRDVTRPFQGQFVICRLGLAMFNLNTKFEMSTITSNEEVKGYAKCKISRFEPPFRELRGNAHGLSMARWKARGRLPVTDNSAFFASSHGTIMRKRNRRFTTGVGHFERKF